MGRSPWERSHRVREIQNPVPSSWRGQQVLGLVWHPLGAKGPVRSRKPCKGKGRKGSLRGSSEEQRELLGCGDVLPVLWAGVCRAV